MECQMENKKEFNCNEIIIKIFFLFQFLKFILFVVKGTLTTIENYTSSSKSHVLQVQRTNRQGSLSEFPILLSSTQYEVVMHRQFGRRERMLKRVCASLVREEELWGTTEFVGISVEQATPDTRT